jgi:hypothetical protein
MSDGPFMRVFYANRSGIGSLYEAQVFVRRWAIRDQDPAVRALLRRIEKVNSTEGADRALVELRRELSARGLLADADAPAAQIARSSARACVGAAHLIHCRRERERKSASNRYLSAASAACDGAGRTRCRDHGARPGPVAK